MEREEIRIKAHRLHERLMGLNVERESVIRELKQLEDECPHENVNAGINSADGFGVCVDCGKFLKRDGGAQ